MLRARDKGAGQDALELLESSLRTRNSKSLADVTRACGGSDQAPQSGILDVEAIKPDLRRSEPRLGFFLAVSPKSLYEGRFVASRRGLNGGPRAHLKASVRQGSIVRPPVFPPSNVRAFPGLEGLRVGRG